MKKKTALFALSFMMLGGTIGAATGVKISAELKPQNVIVDGSNHNQSVISYKGSTYVPLRSFGDLLGVKVDYKNGNIYLGDSSNTASGSSNISASSYNMNNPAPVGTTQSVRVSNFMEDFSASVVVKEVIRGQKALDMIKEANQFNDDPSQGYEYILAKIGISIQSSKDGKSVDVYSGDFKSFSTNNAEYSAFVSVVEPEPELSGAIYAGGSSEGWVAFQVKKDDISPKFVYGANYDGTGGIWFSLK